MGDRRIKELSVRMHKAIATLKEELAALRTGRASTSILENVLVEAYGSKMPLNQVATLSVPDARQISVQCWDKGTLQAIERAIRDSGLGLNPLNDGGLIRVPLPELTEERRKELVKLVHKYGEQAKVAIRNIRRDGMDALKKAEKSKEISKDDLHLGEKAVQEATDECIAEVDGVVSHKEAEIMQV
ncbi:MAG: ribosome recycling factor [Magnetococcales bacterium]|nr:ribosome recycling factor [Magnetococcales bacterium]